MFDSAEKRRYISQSLSTPNLQSVSFSEFINHQSPSKKVRYDLEIHDAKKITNQVPITEIAEEKSNEKKAVSIEDDVKEDKILKIGTSDSHKDQTEPLNLTTRKTPGADVSCNIKGTLNIFLFVCIFYNRDLFRRYNYACSQSIS